MLPSQRRAAEQPPPHHRHLTLPESPAHPRAPQCWQHIDLFGLLYAASSKNCLVRRVQGGLPETNSTILRVLCYKSSLLPPDRLYMQPQSCHCNPGLCDRSAVQSASGNSSCHLALEAFPAEWPISKAGVATGADAYAIVVALEHPALVSFPTSGSAGLILPVATPSDFSRQLRGDSSVAGFSGGGPVGSLAHTQVPRQRGRRRKTLAELP